MGAKDLLLIQAGAILALMAVLALLKHRTRKKKLHIMMRRGASGRLRPAPRERIDPRAPEAHEPDEP